MLNFIVPPWAKLAAIGAVLALAAGAGWFVRDAFCDAATARAALAAERAAHEATKVDLDAARLTLLIGKSALESIDQAATSREDLIRAKQNSVPPDACRKLNRADLEWLRRVAPD